MRLDRVIEYIESARLETALADTDAAWVAELPADVLRDVRVVASRASRQITDNGYWLIVLSQLEDYDERQRQL